jgi:hypothetical protein
VAAQNSRHSVVNAALACALVVSGLWGWRKYTSEPAWTLTLRYAHSAVGGRFTMPAICEHRKESAELLRGALWLRLATLSRAGRAKMLEALETLADSLEARTHPLGLSLDDRTPESFLAIEAGWLFPGWTTSRELLSPCFQLDVPPFVVVTPEVEEPLTNSASFTPWALTKPTPAERKAIFLAWPLTTAIRMPAGGGTTKPFDLDALRARSEEFHSRLGLVVDHAALNVDVTTIPEATLTQWLALARRFVRLARHTPSRDPEVSTWREALTAPIPTAPLLPWLNLKPGELFVIPKLSAPMKVPSLRAELRSLTGRAVPRDTRL